MAQLVSLTLKSIKYDGEGSNFQRGIDSSREYKQSSNVSFVYLRNKTQAAYSTRVKLLERGSLGRGGNLLPTLVHAISCSSKCITRSALITYNLGLSGCLLELFSDCVSNSGVA